MPSAKQIQELLKLKPLPVEGGYFAETYRSKFTLNQRSLPSGYSAEHALSTAIYYMLTPDTFSAMHRLKGDEVYHFYLGDPTEMLILKPEGTGETLLMGQDIVSGMHLQHVVPSGVWQGSRLAPGGELRFWAQRWRPASIPPISNQARAKS